MKKALLTTLACLLAAFGFAVLTETGSFNAFMMGSEPNAAYDNWISHLAEGIAVANYNIYAPYDVQTTGFGDFRLPNALDVIWWGNMLDLFVAGDYDGAQAVIDLAGAPFQIVEFHDTDTDRTYFLIREIPNLTYYDDNDTFDVYDDEIGAFAYGWGLMVYNPAGTKPGIITIPHPCDDFPTPIFGKITLDSWNVRYLLINGAGREVKWTNVAPYTNSKSLSDPTRNATHPLQLAYKKFADAIRAEFAWREWSPQLHSYDWNTHDGYPNAQISAGNPRYCPNLPIRDISNLKHDLINSSSHLMIPENTVGVHRDVFLNAFYGVNYNVYDFTFDDGFHSYPVNPNIDLPAYTQNQQMIYTQSGTTDYDSYEPFFHMEMDELPSCYEETTNNLHWFYGWDVQEQRWNMGGLFDNFIAYYGRWVEIMDPVLVEMFQMDDEMDPTPPTELYVLNQSLTNATLGWNPSSAYDFETYEILYANEPIGIANYQVFNRDNAAVLASQRCSSVAVTGLNNSSQYYFKIRAKDKNGNYSDLSNEVNTILAPANVTTLTAHGLDNQVRVYWGVGGQSNNQGFKVYRSDAGGPWQMRDSWQTNPALSNPTAYSFEWWDNNVANGTDYAYKVSSTNQNNVEFFYNFPANASPRAIHWLTIRNGSATLADSVAFSANPYASDGSDSYFDVTKNNPGSTYVWNAFWEQYWGNSGTQLAREIKGYYDPDAAVKTWALRTRSDQLETLTLTASGNFDRNEKLWLQDGGAFHNLLAGPYSFGNANSNIRNMTIYWGNLQPKAYISSQPNRIYQGGTTLNLYWSYQYPFLIDHCELSLQNATDSLLVSALIPNNQNSFSWLVPPNVLEMQDCRFVIDVVAVDGVRGRYVSDWHFSLVPQMYLTFIPSRWQMRSNPWLNTDYSIQQVFGSGVAYVPNGLGGWSVTQDYDFGSAYWVYSDEGGFFSSTMPVQNEEYNFDLTPGWNFIPNPHLCPYDIEDLSFTLGGTLYRFGEMVSQGLVAPAVYMFREGVYQTVDRIEPLEAFFVKYYGTVELVPQIRFYPFFDAPDFAPPELGFGLKVNAQISDYWTDTMKLGLHPNATDGFDFNFDLPQGPQLFPGLSALWIAGTDTTVTERDLWSEYKSPFVGETQFKTWNFRYDAGHTEPVTFSFETEGMATGWQIRLDLDGATHYIEASGTAFVWTPPAVGIYEGTIRVSNYQVPASDLVAAPITALKAWPNPFNPEVSISFGLAKSGPVKVELFNVRGQRVTKLADRGFAAGEHRLLWDGKDSRGHSVGSGIYFARVSAGKDSRTIKMIMLK